MPATSSDDEFLDRVSRGSPSVAAELDHRYRQALPACAMGVGWQPSAA